MMQIRRNQKCVSRRNGFRAIAEQEHAAAGEADAEFKAIVIVQDGNGLIREFDGRQIRIADRMIRKQDRLIDNG